MTIKQLFDAIQSQAETDLGVTVGQGWPLWGQDAAPAVPAAALIWQRGEADERLRVSSGALRFNHRMLLAGFATGELGLWSLIGSCETLIENLSEVTAGSRKYTLTAESIERYTPPEENPPEEEAYAFVVSLTFNREK